MTMDVNLTLHRTHAQSTLQAAAISTHEKMLQPLCASVCTTVRYFGVYLPKFAQFVPLGLVPMEGITPQYAKKASQPVRQLMC